MCEAPSDWAVSTAVHEDAGLGGGAVLSYFVVFAVWGSWRAWTKELADRIRVSAALRLAGWLVSWSGDAISKIGIEK